MSKWMHTSVIFVLVACGSGTGSGADRAVPGLDAGPMCAPRAASESTCADGVDDDCDGFVDCLDPQCNDQPCAGGLTCTAGACVAACTDGDGCLPALGQIDNLRPTVRGDNVLVDFSPVAGALDYRIYPYPTSADILTGADGEVVIRDAIYRCSGDRPRLRRDSDGINRLDSSLAVNVHGYTRTAEEALLGYVFLTPDVGREAVYHVSDPNLRGGYAWEYAAPWGSEYNGADYVVGTEARDALLAQGWRDDGIAFYVASGGTRTLYRSYYESDRLVLFYTDGPEQASRAGDGPEARFEILAEPAPGSVPLYRVFYSFAASHDVLAAGEANRDRVLYQGNVPLTTVFWPHVTERTTFVVEALDAGCPWPGGFVAGAASAGDVLGGVATAPRLTLDQARLTSGEVFINGQHDPMSRPRAIARAFVTVDPEPRPAMDWYLGFDDDLGPLENVYADGNGHRIDHDDLFQVELWRAGALDNYSYGSLLGQFSAGSGATFSVIARGVEPQLQADRYLHVTMSVDIGSTNRRYPQIFITDTPLDFDLATEVPRVLMEERLGVLPSEVGGGPLTGHQTIIVQTFGREPELDVEFCDHRGWGVSQQCPKANLYGYHVGTENADFDAPWLPNPVMGDLVGNDRPVRFDVYATTERVYVYIEDRPAGCAILPPGRMPAGRVNVMFGVAAYHIEIDESVTGATPEHGYWGRYSLGHAERRLDDLGISSGVDLPGWDEAALPCGGQYYAGLL